MFQQHIYFIDTQLTTNNKKTQFDIEFAKMEKKSAKNIELLRQETVCSNS